MMKKAIKTAVSVISFLLTVLSVAEAVKLKDSLTKKEN